MQFPDFIMGLPALDIPFPEDVVSARAIRSDAGLMVFFTFHQDITLPPHSHGAQWGSVIEGRVDLTMGGKTRSYRPGESYDIPAGTEHAARVAAGSKVIDVFEEPDRYPLRA
ncbi:cupin domain-containing protein [Actibacterium ureilyticum]|uniref:cupin domain-containing protein n=1 Tax=Actibacterium ureilyticum TaxID=1590614 RepID=UPI000BAAD263|nr:cupin domain-containing protein [Actibacterium ureilyticum]